VVVRGAIALDCRLNGHPFKGESHADIGLDQRQVMLVAGDVKQHYLRSHHSKAVENQYANKNGN